MTVKISVNVDKLLRKINDLRRRAGDRERAARVYYTADHSVPVHEDWPIARRPTNFTVGGPKFLERPARERRDGIAAVIFDTLRRGFSMGEAVLRGARFLREISQNEYCPVDTGELRDSAGERLED